MKKLLGLLTLLFIFIGCGKEENEKGVATEVKKETITITHDLGMSIVPKNPKRVVVLDYGILDTLDALGLGDSVVAIPKDSKVPDYLEKYTGDKYTNLGGLKEIDMETLFSLKPDLILTGGRQATNYDRLSDIAPTVLISRKPEVEYMTFLEDTIDKIEKIYGVEGKDYVEEYNKRLSKVKAKVEGENYSALSLILSSRTLKALTDDGRGSLIFDEGGFENFGSELRENTHGDSISYEYILEKNPDYIFVLDRNSVVDTGETIGAKEQIENELVKKSKAYKEGNIIYLSSAPWYLIEGGLRSTDEMIKDLEEAVLSK